MSHGLNSTVAVIGNQSQMYSNLLSLYFENLLDGTHSRRDQSGQRMSSILLTHRIPHDMSWKNWYRESAQIRKELEWLLPTMASPSTILVIGHSTSEQPCERNYARNFLHKLIDGLGSDARNFHGKVVSVNGIELPPSASLHITAGRLILFLCSTPLAADNNVICYENIENQSILMALNAVEL